MSSSQKARPKLSFHQANEICRRLLPIGDIVWDIAAAMQKSHFAAFLPYSEFVESFGDAIEKTVHRKYVAEISKQRLGCPWPTRLSPEERRLVYDSHFIRALNADRDAANGVPYYAIGTKFPGVESLWRGESDPCRRNMVRYEMLNHEQYRLRSAKVEGEKQAIFVQESELHSLYTKTASGFDMEDRFCAYRNIMDGYAATQGFIYDNRKSAPEFPVFSKQVSNGWCLCWTLQHTDMFALSPLQGTLDFSLDLRSESLVGSVDKAMGREFLQFRYQGIVPGFDRAYWKFLNLRELETVIKAHLYVYKCFSTILESAITAGMSS